MQERSPVYPTSMIWIFVFSFICFRGFINLAYLFVFPSGTVLESIPSMIMMSGRSFPRVSLSTLGRIPATPSGRSAACPATHTHTHTHIHTHTHTHMHTLPMHAPAALPSPPPDTTRSERVPQAWPGPPRPPPAQLCCGPHPWLAGAAAVWRRGGAQLAVEVGFRGQAQVRFRGQAQVRFRGQAQVRVRGLAALKTPIAQKLGCLHSACVQKLLSSFREDSCICTGGSCMCTEGSCICTEGSLMNPSCQLLMGGAVAEAAAKARHGSMSKGGRRTEGGTGTPEEATPAHPGHTCTLYNGGEVQQFSYCTSSCTSLESL